MELSLSATVALVLIGLLSAAFVLWRPKHTRLLPGPKPVALIGNALELDPAKIHQSFEKIAQKYGPLAEFWTFGTRNVTVTDVELAKLMYWERPDSFLRPDLIHDAFKEMKGDGLFSMEGDVWKRHRRLTAPAFAKAAVNKMHHCIEIPLERLIKKWQRCVEESGAKGYAIMNDPRIEMSQLTLDVIMYLACGYDLNAIEEADAVFTQDLASFFNVLNERVIPSLKRTIVRNVVPFWDYKFRASQKRFVDFVLKLIAQTKQDVLAEAERGEPSRSFLLREMILAHSSDDKFTDEELLGNILTVILAGLDTTSILLGWAILFLCKYPEYQKKIRDEIVSVVGESSLPKPEHISKLTLTNNFLQETLRAKGPAPFNALENGDKPFEYKGITFPPNTRFWVLQRQMMNDSVPDPEAFKPERWLDPAMTKDANASFLLSVPFGGGTRICPGRQLAFIEATAALATLVRSFDFELDGPEPDEVLNFVMMSTPFNVKVKQALL